MAMSYKTSEATKYQKEFTQYVKQQVKEQGWKISDNKYQHYRVDIIFYFPRVDMDCNNYYKCCFDSITESGCVWIDDTQACESVKAIRYDSKNPRMEIQIYEMDYIGIFDNRAQLEEFRTNCIQCSRYKEGKCSLLVKSLEGRIQEEIENNICSKFKQNGK